MISPEEIQRAWSVVPKVWDEAPGLSALEKTPANADALAYIDLLTRQVFIDFPRLERDGLMHCLPAIVAHEVGHHVAYPHTLRLSAELMIIGTDLLPKFHASYLNVFYDLLINERVGRDPALRQQLIDVYRSFGASDPMFRFYLSVYESLWSVPGAILGKPVRHPERSDLFAQTFFSLSDIYEQFIYFCSSFASHVLQGPAEDPYRDDDFRDHDDPRPIDYPPDMEPSPAAKRAMERAREKGLLPANVDADGGQGKDPGRAFRRIDRVTSGLPGTEQLPFRRVLAERLYQHLVERTIETLRLPEIPLASDVQIPSMLLTWEYGDDPAAIDWASSISRHGELAAVSPLQRDFIVDEPGTAARGVPRMEIYLDTSGSMPHPLNDLNCMTLAALVLATLALRKGAAVKGIIYSYGPPIVSEWLRSEAEARKALLNYSGGGTDFPFALFAQNAERERDVLRVVISDSDFVHNLSSLKSKARFRDAVSKSLQVGLLLLQVQRSALAKALHPWPENLTHVTVKRADELASLAAHLSQVLLGGAS
jgi:hypothetical protein